MVGLRRRLLERRAYSAVGDLQYIKDRLDTLLGPSMRGPKWRENGDYLSVRECPLPDFCGKADGYRTRNGEGNNYTLHINRNHCGFNCFRCGIKGNERQLRFKLSGAKIQQSSLLKSRSHKSFQDDQLMIQDDQVNEEAAVLLPTAQKVDEWATYSRRLLEQNDKDAIAVMKYLQEERGLNLNTIAFFGVGIKDERFFDKEHNNFVIENCVTFPWLVDYGQEPLSKNRLIRMKLRSIKNKKNMRLDAKGGPWGFFGLSAHKLIQPDVKFVILTEGEYDAMAIYQATGYPAISLPNGASSLHHSLVEQLNNAYECIYLWFDNDESGIAATQKFAKKIGMNKCRFIRNCDHWPKSIKDANDALRHGLDLSLAIAQAESPRHDKIVNFAEFRNIIFHELRNPHAYGGTQCESLPGLMKKLRGFRRGELTLLTGHTGGGKTTLASQISIGIADQGINTLWGSFEVKITKLIQKMIKQKFQQRFGGKYRPKLEDLDDSKLMAIFDQFDSLPFHFLTFHGATNVEIVIEAMTFASQVLDVDFFVLDNLQFMISTTNKFSDKFAAQDEAVSLFRKFATDSNCHILLVVHPRKEIPGTPLTIHSVYGGAKATQEADNVLILNNAPQISTAVVQSYAQKNDVPQITTTTATTNKFKVSDLAKNREAGELGSTILMFDAISNSYIDNQSPAAEGSRN